MLNCTWLLTRKRWGCCGPMMMIRGSCRSGHPLLFADAHQNLLRTTGKEPMTRPKAAWIATKSRLGDPERRLDFVTDGWMEVNSRWGMIVSDGNVMGRSPCPRY